MGRKDLINAEYWAGAHDAEMTDSERAFLRASQQAYVVAKQRRRFRRTISSLSGIAITIGLIAITALYFLSRSAEQVAQLENLSPVSL